MLEQPNLLLVKQSLATIEITEAAIHSFLEKAKSEKVAKIHPKLNL